MAKYDREILKGASEGGMISPSLILGGRHQLLIGRVPEGYELTVVNVPLSSPRDPRAGWRTARDTVRRARDRKLTRACWGC